MAIDVGSIFEKIHALEIELDAELARRAAELRFGFERGKIIFEEEILRRHRDLKTGLWAYIKRANILIVLTAPVIYSLIIPLAILDLFLFVFQAVCFPAYGIKRVRRSDYVVFDRHHLAYLNLIEKINCAFCSYANGLFAYAREIASLTEAYWCPIKHAKRLQGVHSRYKDFTDFGDAAAHARHVEAFYKKLDE